jgi:hypothetical protein
MEHGMAIEWQRTRHRLKASLSDPPAPAEQDDWQPWPAEPTANTPRRCMDQFGDSEEALVS